MSTTIRSPIILVCGGRYYDNEALAFRVLSAIGPLCIIHGACRRWLPGSVRYVGADYYASRFARSRGIAEKSYPAEWAKYGKRAGMLRNQRMLDEEKVIDLVVAFPGGTGTADMVRRARLRGIPIRVEAGA